jgi:hypothetical protein
VAWPEDISVGSEIYTARAVDADTSSDLLYEIESGNDAGVFSIIPTSGEVLLGATLDRETQAEYTLNITATDGIFTAVLELVITVLDVDDNPPTFSQTFYSISLLENSTVGTVLLQLNASDADSGPNSIFEYSVLSGDATGRFTVNANTGDLILAGDLDREQEDLYELVILIQSIYDPSLNDTADVRIEVADVNDSPPIFEASEYEFLVLENVTIGTEIGQVVAGDADPGLNGAISFSISPGSDVFTISTDGSIIIAGELDYEDMAQYMLTIIAKDSGSPQMLASVLVVVSVGDVNDNSPIFTNDMLSVSLLENVPVGTEVATVTATDTDSGTNGEVIYTIDSSGLELLAIDQFSGNVTVASPLDFEVHPSTFQVNVTAYDRGSPSLSASIEIEVELEEVNEFAPVFEQSDYKVKVFEDIAPSTAIVDVNATDMDAGSSGLIEYGILGVDRNLFTINPTTGEISTVGTLDREAETKYTFTVLATNTQYSPMLSSQVTVTVDVLDANDNAPLFAQTEYSSAVAVSTSVGTTILSATATDADLGSNSDIQYTGTDASGLFEVSSSSGDIVLAQALNSTLTVNFSITATDMGAPPLSSSAVITIRVIQTLSVEFSQSGAGFLLEESTSLSQSFGLFANGPPGSGGSLSVSLGSASSTSLYTTALPRAVGVRGAVLDDQVWHDRPEVSVVVQVFGEVGEVHCRQTEVVVTVVPDPRIGSDQTPQVTCPSSTTDGFCEAFVPLPDDWFDHDLSEATGTVTVRLLNSDDLPKTIGTFEIKAEPSDDAIMMSFCFYHPDLRRQEKCSQLQ